MSTAVVLDHTALLALHKAHPVLLGLYVEAGRGQGSLHVPALSLYAAEREKRGVGAYVGARELFVIEPFDPDSAVAAGAVAADWRIGHAVTMALPSAAWPHGRPVLSLQPELYDNTPITPLDPGPSA
ncbi:PIN domain-containing protein [Streptomyces sp. NPDC055722]